MDLKYNKLYWEKLAQKRDRANRNESIGYVLLVIGAMLLWGIMFFGG